MALRLSHLAAPVSSEIGWKTPCCRLIQGTHKRKTTPMENPIFAVETQNTFLCLKPPANMMHFQYCDVTKLWLLEISSWSMKNKVNKPVMPLAMMVPAHRQLFFLELIAAAACTNCVDVPIQPIALFSEFFNNALPFERPSIAIGYRVVDELVTAYSKDSTIFQLLGQRNNAGFISTKTKGWVYLNLTKISSRRFRGTY